MPTVQSRPVKEKATAKAGMKRPAKKPQLKRPAAEKPPRGSVQLAAPAEKPEMFKGTKHDKDHANASVIPQ